MEIKNKYQSPLKMKEIMILESGFRRSEEDIDHLKLGFRPERKIEKIGEDQYKIELEVYLGDDEEKLSLYVKCAAIFETEQENMGLIERNAIAIIFPYVRAYISALTSQPGMSPIVLPPINILAMLNDDRGKHE